MTNDFLALENRRLRNRLQLAESRSRVASEALAALLELLLQTADNLPLEAVIELVKRLESIQQLLTGREGQP